MRPKTKIPTSGQGGKQLGTLWNIAFVLVLCCCIGYAEERPVPVSYDLKVTIDPGQGTIAVRGKIGVPIAARAQTLQFALHETFAIKKLAINDHAAKFSFQPGDPSPIYPATRKR
jgi:hypothetical protein